MKLPRFYNYGPYAGNYGTHSLAFEFPDGRTLYFSYKTLVAFRTKGRLYVRENSWGTTTGKHINAIDGGGKYARADRLSQEAFEAAYREHFGEDLTKLAA